MKLEAACRLRVIGLELKGVGDNASMHPGRYGALVQVWRRQICLAMAHWHGAAVEGEAAVVLAAAAAAVHQQQQKSALALFGCGWRRLFGHARIWCGNIISHLHRVRMRTAVQRCVTACLACLGGSSSLRCGIPCCAHCGIAAARIAVLAACTCTTGYNRVHCVHFERGCATACSSVVAGIVARTSFEFEKKQG